MRRSAYSVALVVSCILSTSVLTPRCEAQTDEYARQLTLAQGYIQERRFWDAVFPLQKAYELKPNPDLLSSIGKAYLATGRATEADVAFSQAIAEGAAIPLEFHHEHGGGGCAGTLYISAGQIRWVSTKQDENFESVIAAIEKLDWFTFSEFADVRGTAPYIKFRLNKKNWRLDYLLYGFGEYQYAGGSSSMVVYSGYDLQNAVKANTFIVRFISKASSLRVNRPTAADAVPAPARSTAALPAVPSQGSSTKVEIQPGMSQEEVKRALGEPIRTIVFGKKTILKYQDITIELEDNKVVEVKGN
jgi:tetratricopeptide (TPR) repeat protein